MTYIEVFSPKKKWLFPRKNTSRKNWLQKLLIIGPNFFSAVLPGCPNQPRIDFSYYKYVPRLICLLICGRYSWQSGLFLLLKAVFGAGWGCRPPKSGLVNPRYQSQNPELLDPFLHTAKHVSHNFKIPFIWNQ